MRFTTKVIETVAGRVIFNQYVPEETGFVDELLTKKKLQTIIADVFKTAGPSERLLSSWMISRNLVSRWHTKVVLSMGLNDVKIPVEKEKFVKDAQKEVDAVWNNYMMGLITDNERYNQVIDIWTRANTMLTNTLDESIREDDNQGFNPIYMMMHSGARGSREQIRQFGGMRGLMAKPQKNLAGSVGSIIENPILSNFKEGLDVLEYFISTHGARKGLGRYSVENCRCGLLNPKVSRRCTRSW